MTMRVHHKDGSTGDYEATLRRGGLILIHAGRHDHLISTGSDLSRYEVIDATPMERIQLHFAGFGSLKVVDVSEHFDNP